MELAILLAVAASFCTATSSVCQRLGARGVHVTGFDPWLVFRRAAILGVATGISWGFVAAVIKELSSHLGQGLGAVFANWAVYVLATTGAGAFLLVSHALAAGPLAASQPGFTILDPLTASLLGLFLFGESMRTGPLALAGEVAGLAVLVAGVVALSHSRLITGEEHPGQCNQIDGHVHAQAELASRETKR